jgi:hypothetical protein
MKEKAFCVSVGYENIVAERIKVINDIIKNTSNASIKEVVDKIANVSPWVWYACYSKGAMRGRISNKTVASLKNFFGIPEEVFAGKGEFSNEYREIIVSKIKEVFGNIPKAKRGPKVKKVMAIKEKAIKKPAKAKKVKAKKAKPENKKPMLIAKPKRKAGRPKKIKETVEKANVKKPSSIDARLKEFAHEIEGIKVLEQMNGLSEILAKLSNIANKKMELLTAFQSL